MATLASEDDSIGKRGGISCIRAKPAPNAGQASHGDKFVDSWLGLGLGRLSRGFPNNVGCSGPPSGSRSLAAPVRVRGLAAPPLRTGPDEVIICLELRADSLSLEPFVPDTDNITNLPT